MFYKYGKRTHNFLWVFFYLYFSFLWFGNILIKQFIPHTLLRYEMIIANMVLHASLVIYHLLSKVCLWNNCSLTPESF